MNLNELFAIPLAQRPGHLALEAREADGVVSELSFEILHAAAGRLAGGLSRLGLQRGDRVAFFLGNRVEFVVAYLAVLRLGAAMVPINLAYRKREIAHILGDAEPRFLITEASQRSVLEELEAGERAAVETVLYVEDFGGIALDEPTAPVAVSGDELALLMYTSGTTGRSKGAMLSHDNVLATVAALMVAWEWSGDDTILLTLPLFHTHGVVVALHCALAAGATVRLRRRFDADSVASELAAGAATLFFGVPTMYVRLVEELRRSGRGADLGRLRLFCSGSAPLSPETFHAFAELTGQRILERYGMTETGMLLSNPYAPASARRPGTVGTPLPGVSARIVVGSGSELCDVEAGGEGELLVAGAHVFVGYWRASEKTTQSFSQDGDGRRWFHTGDLARLDPETGHITLLGRRHELIIAGGFNVYPREIEEVLESLPGVHEAAVVGRPHPEWGEVAVAFLVAEPGLAEGDVIAWCKQQLAGFKAPRAVRFVEELPRNALGKVQKHLLPRD